MKNRKLRIGVMMLAAILTAMTGMGYAAASSVEDITKEVLTGPSETSPEKILGPGSVGVTTYKDILMSFGATVRLIPTYESNWDFGLSDKVPGYIKTGPLKALAEAALNTAKAADNMSIASQSLNNSLTRGDKAVVAGFNDFANSVYQAAETPAIKANPTLNAGVSTLAGSAVALQTAAQTATQSIALPIASPVANAAAAAAAAAAIQPNATSDTITAAAYAAGKTTYTASVSTLTDDKQKAIATVSGEASAKAAAAAAATSASMAVQYATKEAISAGADQTTAGKIAQESARLAALTPANNAAASAGADAASAAVIASKAPDLVKGANTISSNVATTITKNPSATTSEAVADMTASKAQSDALKPYYLANSFLRAHSNESGNVKDGYIRNEDKIYFNAMPKDKKWSFYAALEFDRPLETTTVDNRGGKTDGSSNFGLERLNASMEIVPELLRLHGGWDVWGLDIIEGPAMIYGDDNPGFWIKGQYKDLLSYSVGWFKLQENNFQISASDQGGAKDQDRDLFAGYMDYKFCPTSKIRFFYAYDRIRDVPSSDLLGAMGAQKGTDWGIYGNNGIPKSKVSPDTNAQTVGAYYTATIGKVGLMAEGAYKFGKAENTGLKGVDNGIQTIQYDDFDIESYAFAADVNVELVDYLPSDWSWKSFKPHVGFIYTSGDKDGTDNKLGGFNGVENAERFSEIWGGENTIIADTNFVLGTVLYGFIPELYGNGTPVFVGGLQNFAGTGSGRGDNPGLSMISVGLKLEPRVFLFYRTNINIFRWNEDFYVGDMVNPANRTPTRISAGYVGTEWDNEITLALSKHTFIKGQFSFFFPGGTIKDVTKALSGGIEADEMAMRLGAELIWNF